MDGKTWSELLGEIEEESEERSEFDAIVEDYLLNIDGALIEQGWDFTGAKTVGFGYHDQSLLNHVRNGVFFLLRVNSVAENLGGRTLDSNELRNALGMFVAHDLHKTRETDGPEEEFDIPRELVAEFVEETGLLEFAPELTVEDCWSCACAHHDSWNAKAGRTTLAFTELQGYVRLADAFASSPTPEDAVNERTRNRFEDVFSDELDLRYHQLTDVKGVLTNLCNRAVAAHLQEREYQVLAIYQDGCVYAAPADAPESTIDESVVADIYDRFTETVRRSHPSYANPAALMDSITTARLGYYDPSDQEFFYAGPERVLAAMVRKAAQDGDTDDDPTDSMSEGITKVDDEVPIPLDDTRQLVGAARLVYGIHRHIVPELDADEEDLLVTCALFGVDGDVRDALLETREREPNLLKSGGKWEYSYAIAQELLDHEFEGVAVKDLSAARFGEEVTDLLVSRLTEYDGWATISEAFTADIRRELVAYLEDVLVIDGRAMQADSELTDAFDEYTAKRGGKLCTLCNRGTTSTRKSDMETKKSLSTLQAGFSNRTQIGAGKPEQLLMCAPCQIEFSLRETGSTRREAGRLFFHFVPDYFYTPLSWELTRGLLNRYTGEARVRMGRLAEQLFEGRGNVEEYRTVLSDLTADEDEGGMRMVENLAQGFEEGFGAAQMGYYKPNDNDTEFQFFGVYLALAIASYSGLRVFVSENPIPEIRGRDFQEMARLGAGITPVKRFYGETITLEEFEDTLTSASALIRLGYANEREDSLFAKYLRTTRNKALPGSYLLKRIVRDSPDEGSRIAWNLMDEAKHLDTTTGVSQTDD